MVEFGGEEGIGSVCFFGEAAEELLIDLRRGHQQGGGGYFRDGLEELFRISSENLKPSQQSEASDSPSPEQAGLRELNPCRR